MSTEVSQLFEVEVLSETEEALLIEFYKNPVVKKHLKIMAQNDANELIQLSTSGKTERELALAHEHIRGRLSTISTLFSI
jgi:hypothetical protein